MKRLVLPLRTWLVLSHLVVLLLPIIALLATRALAYDLRDQTRRSLEYQGVLIAMLAASEVDNTRSEQPSAGLLQAKDPLTSVLVRTKRATLAGIRLVDTHGIVVVSSGDGLGQDLSNDDEVREALVAGGVGVAVRPRPSSLSSRSLSPSSPHPLSSQSRRASVRLFVTVPIVLNGEPLGAVVLSRTPREEVQAIYQMAPRLWWGALAAVLLTISLALFYGYLFSRSLRTMSKLSTAIAQRPDTAAALLKGPRTSHVREVADVAEALISTAERLDERLAYIGEFAANVSHEFKTPLSTLRGTIELLQDDDTMPAEQRSRFLTNAANELTRLDTMVTGLLTLARAERTTERAPVDMDLLLRTLAERHSPTQFTGTAGTILGDREQLDLAIGNLLANAHTHGGSDVSITAKRTAKTLLITVQDSGPGISEANQKQLFDRFFTTARHQGGTGLGLAIVQTVVQAHRGTVTVESEPGRTRFQLLFRVQPGKP